MSKELIARRKYPYAGVMRNIGDPFTASDKDADLMIAVGAATLKVNDARPAKPKKQKQEQHEQKPAAVGRRGKYLRSDMRAED